MFCKHIDYDDYFERCNYCELDKAAICKLDNICFNCGIGIVEVREHNGNIFCSQACVNEAVEIEG